ncbi:hypothetical protein [Mucilaginibacter myungsuensis]|uniref:Uncharacterized protein n=1 Tax=Mucilaginibacter myungsuensis TaxID=649104 RepID=A0A929KWV6_9SPHI|nr:hypothetical protein [Mucilaginibacter myungsuensis]MBE9660389.1 hypothetical protein [Mucilaginibacter myungsuensis]MDN3600431.1 hypothetical protein [Mucilaginibacter myungsuensis]
MIFHLLALLSRVKTYFQIRTIQKNFNLDRKLGEKVNLKQRDESILIVIAHVVPVATTNKADRLKKLKECLDSIKSSIAGYQHRIVILTKEGYSLHSLLPSYLIFDLQIHLSHQQDPMLVEFDAFEVFKEQKDSYDHFLFLEDDILINDSWFLEKIKAFNTAIDNNEYVLLPHRFEYSEGIKYYLDQTTTYGTSTAHYHHNDTMSIEIENVKYCTYENPHAAWYCLTKKQLNSWIASGYKWKSKIVAFGPLESAATFSLLENFKFLKPHPRNINYFEVQHCGNKYIKQAGLIKQDHA